MIITHSSLECFKTCHKKYKLRFLYWIVPKRKSAALEFGSLMHRLLERYLKCVSLSQDMGEPADTNEDFYEKLYTILNDWFAEDLKSFSADKIETAKLMGLINGYVKTYYKSDIENYEVIDVEKEFVADTGINGVKFAGKVDGLVRSKKDGAYYIIEHKTAGIMDDDYVNQKQIDSQTMTYAIWLESQLGIEISGVIHDIIMKQKIRLKKGETEDEFCERLKEDVSTENFRRITVNLSRDSLHSFKSELLSACEDLKGCKNYYKCTGSCLGKYGACEYLPLCIAEEQDKEASLTDLMGDDFTKSRPHKELSDKTWSEVNSDSQE